MYWAWTCEYAWCRPTCTQCQKDDPSALTRDKQILSARGDVQQCKLMHLISVRYFFGNIHWPPAERAHDIIIAHTNWHEQCLYHSRAAVMVHNLWPCVQAHEWQSQNMNRLGGVRLNLYRWELMQWQLVLFIYTQRNIKTHTVHVLIVMIVTPVSFCSHLVWHIA